MHVKEAKGFVPQLESRIAECPFPLRHFCYSLVAPVQSRSDVLLDIPHAVMGEVAHQNLPPKVQDFIHHATKPAEHTPVILLLEEETREE